MFSVGQGLHRSCVHGVECAEQFLHVVLLHPRLLQQWARSAHLTGEKLRSERLRRGQEPRQRLVGGLEHAGRSHLARQKPLLVPGLVCGSHVTTERQILLHSKQQVLGTHDITGITPWMGKQTPFLKNG